MVLTLTFAVLEYVSRVTGAGVATRVCGHQHFHLYATATDDDALAGHQLLLVLVPGQSGLWRPCRFTEHVHSVPLPLDHECGRDEAQYRWCCKDKVGEMRPSTGGAAKTR